MFECWESVKVDILDSKGEGGGRIMKYPVFLDLSPYSMAELYHVSDVSAATFVKVCCTLQEVMS